MEVSCGSMNALMETPHDIYCYGHFGAVKGGGASLLAAHKDQVQLWARVIEREMAPPGDDFEERCLKRLLAEDANLSLHPCLPDDVKEREKGFMFNSIRGIAGYLRDRQAAAKE